MTKVVLIRPGSTDYDEQNRIQGTLDLPLSARGTEEAAAVAEALRAASVEALYCCAGESCGATARTIAKALGLRLRKLDKLHNLNQGLWQGLQVEEVRRKHPRVYRQWCESPTTVCPPNGETISDAAERVRQALMPVIKRNRDKVIGLVVPQPLAGVVRCFLLKHELARVWEQSATNGRFEILEVPSEQSPPKT
jgi:broad specificity phosphatase PhoE